MKGVLDQFAHAFFQKESWEALPLEELRSFAQKHPYFAGGQVLLALKSKEQGANEAEAAETTASLYVSNTLVYDLMSRSLTQSVREKAVETFTPSAPVPEVLAVMETTVEPEAEPEPEIPVEENAEIRQLLSRELELSTQKTSLDFAPQHTIDYFASQGIRNKPEEMGNDRFSHQLRSFTEWLKTLKKISPDQAVPATTGAEEEARVTHLAEGSLAEKEVLTEAMAEVWLKQGDTVKAAAIYTKLSLLNPAKSAYFASLIDKINASK